MKILMIGGTGFIGGPLTKRLLEEQHDVAVFHRGSLAQVISHENLSFIQGDRKDLLDYQEALRQFEPEVVIDVIAYQVEDAWLLRKVLEPLKPRIILLSSADVYQAYGVLLGDTHELATLPITEESPLRDYLYPYRGGVEVKEGFDEFLYNYDKILIEQILQASPDLKTTILRLPALYGPGDRQHKLAPYLKRMADQRPFILLDQRKANWHWTRGYIEDIIEAILLATTHPKAESQIYNVGEAEAFPEKILIQKLAEMTQWSGEIVEVEQTQLPPALQEHYNWGQDLIVDSQKIRKELGYQEKHTWEEGIKKTINFELSFYENNPEALAFDYKAEDQARAKLKG